MILRRTRATDGRSSLVHAFCQTVLAAAPIFVSEVWAVFVMADENLDGWNQAANGRTRPRAGLRVSHLVLTTRKALTQNQHKVSDVEINI